MRVLILLCLVGLAWAAPPREDDNVYFYHGRYYHDYTGHYEHKPHEGRYYHDTAGHYRHDDSGGYDHDNSGQYDGDNGKYNHQDNPYLHQTGPNGGAGGNEPYRHVKDKIVPYKGDNDRYRGDGGRGRGTPKPAVLPKPKPVVPKPVVPKPVVPKVAGTKNTGGAKTKPGFPNLIGANTFQNQAISTKPSGKISEPVPKKNLVAPNQLFTNFKKPSPGEADLNGYHWEYFDGPQITSADVPKYTPEVSQIGNIDDKGFFKLTAPYEVKYAIVYQAE